MEYGSSYVNDIILPLNYCVACFNRPQPEITKLFNKSTNRRLADDIWITEIFVETFDLSRLDIYVLDTELGIW